MTLSDKLLVVAICWVLLAALGACLRFLPRRLAPGAMNRVGWPEWAVLSGLAVVVAVGIFSVNSAPFYVPAFLGVLAAYIIIKVRLRSSSKADQPD